MQVTFVGGSSRLGIAARKRVLMLSTMRIMTRAVFLWSFSSDLKSMFRNGSKPGPGPPPALVGGAPGAGAAGGGAAAPSRSTWQKLQRTPSDSVMPRMIGTTESVGMVFGRT